MNDAKLGDFLAKLGVISPQQLHTAREAQAANGGRLASILTNMGFVSEEELARLAATALRLPYVSLEGVVVPKELIEKLPREQARKAKGVLVKVEGKKFFFATCDPTNVQAFDEMQFVLNGRVMPVVAAELEVIRAIGHYYGERVIPDRRFDLPKSVTLDYDKAEVFDIKAARAKKQAASSKVDLSLSSDATNHKAAADRLSAAASQVKRPGAPAAPSAQAGAPVKRSIDLADVPSAKPTAPAQPARPKPQPPAAPAPRSVPADEAMPMIRDAHDLEEPALTVAGEPDEDLEVLELVEDGDEAEVALVAEPDVPAPVNAAAAPVEAPVETPVAPPAPAGDDIFSLFNTISFGAEPSAPMSAEASAEADELAKLFMGALSGQGGDSTQTPGGDNQAVNDMAAELAHLLLDQTDFSA